MKKGFTLLEMMLVIGIIAILSGTAFVGMGKITRRAQKAKAQELVSNVATALAYILQSEMEWPQPLIDASKGNQGKLDRNVATVFCRRNLLGLTYTKETDQTTGDVRYVLRGADRFGVVSPWAHDLLKRNENASEGSKVKTGGTVFDHIVRYSIDSEGRGITDVALKGKTIRVRAPAAAWCFGADGVEGDFNMADREDDTYSWSRAQIMNK